MKYVLGLVLGLGLVFSTSVSLAATPVAVVCDYPDRAVWDNSNTIKVGCIKEADWLRAEAEVAEKISHSLIGGLNFVTVLRGQSVKLLSGYVDTCPPWFPLQMNCVIKAELLAK